MELRPERLPVWTALSELFLDTEIMDADVRRIANVLLQSPYDRGELKSIFRDEVAPAFTFNLLSIAGEWTPWDENEVQAIVEEWLKQRSGGWFARLRSYVRPRIIPSEWGRIAALLK